MIDYNKSEIHNMKNMSEVRNTVLEIPVTLVESLTME